jgi:hypothetical protein
MPKPRKRKIANNVEKLLGIGGATTAQAADLFSNSGARMGFGTPSLGQGAEYNLVRLSYDYWNLITLFRNHWISRRIVEVPAQDMVKAWPTMTSDIEPKDITRINRALRKTNTKNNILTGLTWGRLFGGAGGLMVIDGQENELDQPLDLESVKIGAYKGVIPFDRWAGIHPSGDVCTDINRPLDFGKPETYDVTPAGGTSFQVHSSRVLRFLGPTVPTPEVEAQSWWGISVLEPSYESITMLDNTMWNILSLTFRANLLGMKFPELAQMLSGLGSSQMATQKFEQRMTALNHLMSNNSLIPLPADGSIESTQFSFGGLGEIFQLFQLNLAGAAQMPVTRLFGRTYNGLGQAGDGDEKIYEEKISTDQATYLLPQLEKLYPVVCMSELGEVPDDLDLLCPSIRVLDEKDKAELAKAVADTTTVYLNGGIMSPRKVAQEVKRTSDVTGIGSTLDDEFIQKLSDDVTSEGELGEGLFGGEGAGLGEADSPAKAIKAENKTGQGEDPDEPKAKPEDNDEKKGPELVKKKAGKATDIAPDLPVLPTGLKVGEALLFGGQTRVVASIGDAIEDLDGKTAVPVRFTDGSIVAYATDARHGTRPLRKKAEDTLSNRTFKSLQTAQEYAEGAADIEGKPVYVAELWDGHKLQRLGYKLSFAGEGSVYKAEVPRHRSFDEDGASSVTNRAQGMLDYHALPVRVETPEGGVRTGVTPDGVSWSTTMPADYGFIDMGINGSDGDSIDCYVGPSPESSNVFVVDQYDVNGKNFDETKCMIGYHTVESAKEDYMLGHHLSSMTFAAITSFTMPMFRRWLATHDHSKPCDAGVL